MERYHYALILVGALLVSTANAVELAKKKGAIHIDAPNHESPVPPARQDFEPPLGEIKPVLPRPEAPEKAPEKNPGRKFGFKQADGTDSFCQHTFFDRVGESCFSLSATHCFGGLLQDKEKTEENSDPHADDFSVVEFQMNSEELGTVSAKAHLNQKYFKNDSNDVAVIEWSCSDEPQLPRIPLCKSGIENNERIRYGKIMGEAGLYKGIARTKTYFRTEEGLQAYRVSDRGTVEVQMSGPAVQQGDSGGPLMKEAEDCLLGALSGTAHFEGVDRALYGVGEKGGENTDVAPFVDRLLGRGTRAASLESPFQKGR
ncbi:MAG: trypsin-like serine protease [Bdellovibrionales bacterium]|nr:trypsin-like serine protease [Bdellovibrionales bacterium]